MKYIAVARNPNRVLNHIEHIKRIVKIIESNDFNDPALHIAPHIELQLTDACNLGCSFCHFRNQGDLHFNFEQLDYIVNKIQPQAITLSGGGEPTVYPKFNDAVVKLQQNIPNVEIGLITNGIRTPNGDWHKALSWVRISVYSVLSGSYSGRASSTYDLVLKNIRWYLEKTTIPHIGIGFVFYADNIHKSIELIQKIASLVTFDTDDAKRINVQFRPVFIVSRPSILSDHLHQENIKLIPTLEQLRSVAEEFEHLLNKNIGYKNFIEQNTNYEIFSNLATKGHSQLIGITDPKGDIPNNFHKCYMSQAYRLITPNGNVYPCFTLAEHRDLAFSLGNIADGCAQIGKKALAFYNASTECCNSRFCRNTEHNQILDKNISNIVDHIPNDPFF